MITNSVSPLKLLAAAALLAAGGAIHAADVAWTGATDSAWGDPANWSGGTPPAVTNSVQIGTGIGVTTSVLDLGGATSVALTGTTPAAGSGTGLTGDTAAINFGSVGGTTAYTIQNGTINMGAGEAILRMGDGITVDWNVNSSGATSSQARFWQIGGGSTLNIASGSTHNSRFATFNGGASGTTAVVNLAATDFDNSQPWMVGSGNGSTASSSRVSRNLTLNVNADQSLTSTLQVGYAFVGYKSKVVVRNGATLNTTGTVSLGESNGSAGQGILQVGDGGTSGSFTQSGNALRLGTHTGTGTTGGAEGILDIVNGTANLNAASSVLLGYGARPDSKGTINVGADGTLNTRSNFTLQTGATAGNGVISFDGGKLRVDSGSIGSIRSNLIDASVVVNIRDGGMVFDANNKSDTVINAALLNGGTGGLEVRDLTGGTNGKLTLNGVNTYAGLTNVRDSSTLILGASSSIADSSGVQISPNATLDVSAVTGFTLGAGQTLKGGGTVVGGITVAGIHAPGFSPGTQIFSDGLTYAGTSTLVWELTDNTSVGRGTIFDAVDVSGGAFALGAGSTIDLSFGGTVDFLDAFWGMDQEWLVVDLSGAASTSDSNGFLIGTISGGANYDGGLGSFGIERKAGSNAADSVYLIWTAVPEPETALLGGLGLLALIRRRRD